MKITRQLDPNAGTGTGQSIFDVGMGVPGAGTTPPPTPPTPPTPPAGTTPAAPTEAELAADNALFDSLSSKEEASLTAEEKVKFAELKAKYDTLEVDADGNAITPEAKAALEATAKRIEAIKAKADNQRTVEEIQFLAENDAPVVSVYDQVDELVGAKVEVDYKGVSPLSPEGIVLRETAIREQAVQSYDAELKEGYPVAYQLLLHLQAGGDVTNFLQGDTDDYQSIVLVKEDKATQENIYRKALTLRGNTAEQIDGLVQIAKDKGKLYENSKVELEALQKKQVLEEKAREQQAAANKVAEVKLTQNFYTQLNTLMEKGLSGLVIPKAERKEFADFVTSNTYVRDGKLIYYKELKTEEIESELAMNYFKFKKGDLAKLVERRAGTLKADEKRNAIKIKLVPKNTGAAAAKSYVPFSQV